MRQSAPLLQAYPVFAAWLTGGFRETVSAPEILDEFVDFTGLSTARALSFLTGGTLSPALYAEDLGWTWGQFRPANPFMVFIHQNIVRAVEADPSAPRPRTFATAKILHELVHCGRAESRLGQHNDPGARFEGRVFGGGSGEQLMGQDYLPAEFIPEVLRSLRAA
jgi:hypothetical protein